MFLISVLNYLEQFSGSGEKLGKTDVIYYVVFEPFVRNSVLLGFNFDYCRPGNIREVLIFANFARRTNSRIQKSREIILKKALLKKKEN